MPKGYLSFILHAHLPYVRHPEFSRSLEEKWFFEGMTECYIPIIDVLQNLNQEGVNFHITFSLSPTLLSMMEDKFMQERYSEYLERLQNLALREMERTEGDPVFHPLAQMYREKLDTAAFIFHKYNQRLVNAFKELQQGGNVEIITTAATHGYLPLLGLHKETVYAQLSTALDYYEDLFETTPRGIWLPECAYDPSMEDILSELGVQYFVTDTHGVLYASPRPKYGVYSPILTPGELAVFARDPETSSQVWSADEGYPGDPDYREFYRDIGFDLEKDHVEEFLHPPNIRSDTGFKYYRITGPTNHKEPYNREAALNKAREHAANFMFNREKQVEYYGEMMDRPPIVTSPYDTELFGHWWFEGPEWLGYVFRFVDQNEMLETITPGKYLDKSYPLQESIPNQSSWGDKGYHEVWLNGTNDWLYRHLHAAAEKMIDMATEFPQSEGDVKRALTQAARELFLAQSSDWPFIMNAGTMDQYAESRVVSHLLRFFKIEREIREHNIDSNWLSKIEAKDNIFPHLDYRVFQKLSETVAVEKGELAEISSD